MVVIRHPVSGMEGGGEDVILCLSLCEVLSTLAGACLVDEALETSSYSKEEWTWTASCRVVNSCVA